MRTATYFCTNEMRFPPEKPTCDQARYRPAMLGMVHTDQSELEPVIAITTSSSISANTRQRDAERDEGATVVFSGAGVLPQCSDRDNDERQTLKRSPRRAMLASGASRI